MIKVGVSTRHGMADEAAACPPDGVELVFPPVRPAPWPIRSPIKCYMQRVLCDDCDVIEAMLGPVLTKKPWICSLGCFQEAVAFSLGPFPVPRALRVRLVEKLFLADNCKGLVFWSEAARKTMGEYGGVTNEELHRKSCVVYPAIRDVPPRADARQRSTVNLLFGGDFFRKGGANVVDTFLALRKRYPQLRLQLCCDPDRDFSTPNEALKQEYLRKAHSDNAITVGRVSRKEMLESVLPSTDIVLLPTYNEAFGFALLEAMAFGIPVISTNVFAIPEIVEHGVSGLLIDISSYSPEHLFRGYTVREIPPGFFESVSEQLNEHMVRLIESEALRRELGQAGIARVKKRFSFAARNREMLAVYRAAVA